MRILVINGNPKETGFLAEVENVVRERVDERGHSAAVLRLVDSRVEECVGCFQCLKTGACFIEDDVEAMIEAMVEADGIVTLGGVRNGTVAACFKRLYERLTYPVGFPLLLENTYTLAISSVGYMGGKVESKRFLGFQDVFHSRLSGHLHFSVGIPSRPMEDRVRERIRAAVDRLLRDIESKRGRGFASTVQFAVDRAVMGRFMFAKKPEVYANVIKHWREKGYYR